MILLMTLTLNWPFLITLPRCLFSVSFRVFLNVAVGILALIVGFFKVGSASFFKSNLMLSVYPVNWRYCGECAGSHASSAKWSEQILVQDEGFNDLRLQNSIHAFLLRCWSGVLPPGKLKKLILSSEFFYCNRKLDNASFRLRTDCRNNTRSKFVSYTCVLYI